MTTVAIPEWNTLGLLPPTDPNNPTSTERSPYKVSLLDIILRFATSPERCKVLNGFLDYRAALHGMGLVSGFQWLDGSFTEQVETLERRAPKDLDVVTFVHVPDDFAPSDEQIEMLDNEVAMSQFLVDGYFVEINQQPLEIIVERSAYWYSMWSHRRNEAWKGYLQIDLNPLQDADARERLTQLNSQEL
jgi:hypothetical protein